ncbi:MAG: hypothetical protein LLG37_10610 [Spirochaetia bacterium]|nr:hypothetical protein [Spirochaetia bacterium]
MKPFDCDICGMKARSRDAVVKWHHDRLKKSSENFLIVHATGPCGSKDAPDGTRGYFNRFLRAEYVFGRMPEFLTYITRHKVNERELKKFTARIEKDRSYIRRHNVDKKEVKKLIIRMDGLE